MDGPRAVVENAAADGRIKLEPIEIQVFDLFKLVAQAIADQTQQMLTLRVAGGWVRDKLLGLHSLDIDITLNTLQGRAFALAVRDYVAAHGLTDVDFKLVAEAEQSKHLNVATIVVYGVEIDLNSLRKEVYNSDSRIPEVTDGTTWDDVARRDLTLNALYYDIIADVIEDWDGRGLADLQDGVVRCIGDARTKFMEDPLRVIRMARYAGRYNFVIDEDARNQAQDQDIHKAMINKVSRERFGMELEKVFKAKNPVACLQHLSELGLFRLLFELPDVYTLDDTESTSKFPYFPVPLYYLRHTEIAQAALAVVQAADSAIHAQSEPISKEDQELILLAAFVSPFWGYVCNKSKQVIQRSVVFEVLCRSLRLKKNLAESVSRLLLSAQEILKVSRQWIVRCFPMPTLGMSPSRTSFQANPDQLPMLEEAVPREMRLALGKAMMAAGDHWRASLLLADCFAQHFHAFTLARFLPSAMISHWVEQSGLLGCHAWAPLFTGKEMTQLFGVKGRGIGHALSAVTEFRLLNPEAEREEALAWLKQQIDTGALQC
eukprot:TRINITY_DN4346_c0_g1_i1.p1 TRINITY_DN4346_c0_g1~~TRINITY_DN4346_c0_g1_i1.p1  ORF type:complete len:546 (+),score=121.99 TRINITY_DN4346_c0_g1_i1:179-1816(+)